MSSVLSALRTLAAVGLATLLLAMGSPGSAQVLRGQAALAVLSDTTTFGRLAAGAAWNAYFGPDGRVTYWRTVEEIRHGSWRVAPDGAVCISLRGTECRYLQRRSDGSYGWLDPRTRQATSVFFRLVPGDVLGLRARRDGSTLTARYALRGAPRWLQTHSRLDFDTARNEALGLLRAGFADASVLLHRNGYFAVVALADEQPSEARLDLWKRRGVVPWDAFYTRGSGYVSLSRATAFPGFEDQRRDLERRAPQAAAPDRTSDVAFGLAALVLGGLAIAWMFSGGSGAATSDSAPASVPDPGPTDLERHICRMDPASC